VTQLTERKNNKKNSQAITASALSQTPIGVLLPEPLLAFSQGGDPQPTVVLRSEHLGENNPVLGDRLMADFLQALQQHHEPPKALLLYNTAVNLVLETSPVLESIRQLAAKGCEVLACRTSLQVLAPDRMPVVGRAVPMCELTDRMLLARQILWP